ncbi:MAG: hypothetical protein A2X64_02040 [Ignavibacteria bacterium GWF2_33_9]|nr:MAG: hypothetical protein A2X64_02040 [Ignavibacteria bacterium GWF2_33_9]
MEQTKFTFWKKVDLTFDQAIERATEELQKEGFGIITQVDITGTMKNKLGIDFKPYRILGACNPGYAHKVLSQEEQIGVLLPCNFVVYVNDAQETIVAAVNPLETMKAVDNPNLADIALQVQEKIKNALAGI